MNILLFLLNLFLVSCYPVSWFESATKTVVNTAIERVPVVTEFGVKVMTEAAFENPRNAHQVLNIIGEASGKSAAKNFKGTLRVAQEFGIGAGGEFLKAARIKAEETVVAVKTLAEKISNASRKWLSKITGLKSLAPTVEEVVEHTALPVEEVKDMSLFGRIAQIYHGISDTVTYIKTQTAIISAEVSHRATIESAKIGIAVAGNQITRETNMEIAQNVAEEILKSVPSNAIVRDFGKDFAQMAMQKPLAAASLTISAASGLIPSLTIAYAKAFGGFVKNTARLAAALPTKSIKAANEALSVLANRIGSNTHLLRRSIDIPIPQEEMAETAETLAIARDLVKSIKEFEGLSAQLKAIEAAHQ